MFILHFASISLPVHLATSFDVYRNVATLLWCSFLLLQFSSNMYMPTFDSQVSRCSRTKTLQTIVFNQQFIVYQVLTCDSLPFPGKSSILSRPISFEELESLRVFHDNYDITIFNEKIYKYLLWHLLISMYCDEI